MIKKFGLLVLLCFGIAYAADEDKILQPPVKLSFGNEWDQNKRKDNSLAVSCPFQTSNGNNCLITELSFEEGKIYYSFYQDLMTNNANFSNAGTRNIVGGSNTDFNIYELLDINFQTKNIEEVPNNPNTVALKEIIDNANGNNAFIYPLYFEKIRGLYYNTDTNITRPFLGFAAINTDSQKFAEKNPFLQVLGATLEKENSNGFVLNNLVGKTPSKINQVYSLTEVADFGSIGQTLGEWLEKNNDSPSKGIGLETLKAYFNYEADDNSQTWSRVMAGVAVLDDSYIKKLEKGELILNPISRPAIKPGETTDLDGNNKIASSEWWGKNKSSDNLFSQTSDSKLWGYYLYLSQNLHKIEILLILALAGASFTFVTGWKGFNYFRQINSEQKEPLDWKKMIMQPVTYTLLIATPLVPTNTTVDPNYILDSSPIVASLKVDNLNIDNSSEDLFGEYDEKLFYQTPLQVFIQGAVGFGSAIADEFSKALTYSFATFIAFREEIVDDSANLLNSLKKEYNQLSSDLITLSAYQTFYLSTCKYDYVYGNKELSNITAHVLPNTINSHASNDVFQVRFLGGNKIFEKFDKGTAYADVPTCSKIENELQKRSKDLMPRLLSFSSEFTAHSNKFIANNGEDFGHINEYRVKDLKEKIAKLSFYERNYGWVNVAMLPLLYQIMYPSFNPYYYAEKTNSLDSGNANMQNVSEQLALSQLYTVIGDTATFNNLSIKNKEHDKLLAQSFTTADLGSGWFSSILNYIISFTSYSFMPGYNSVENNVKELHIMIAGGSKEEGIKHSTTASGVEFLLGILADETLRKSGSTWGPNFTKLLTTLGISEAVAVIGQEQSLQDMVRKFSFGVLDPTKVQPFVDMMLIKLTAQTLYLYILNLMVMVILAVILLFKIGMFFLQVIIFYMASPLVLLWALITKKEEQMKNYVTKATTLIFSPILITLSGTILILGVGILHQIYFIITNHVMNIQLHGAGENWLLSIAQYVQLQAFFGIGNIILGFVYLLLGYVILIKFSHWFFETIGIQTQSSITQGLESLTHRMRFGSGLGM